MNSTNLRRGSTVLILAWGAGVFALDYFSALPALRPALVIGFLMICPGMAFIRLLDLNNPWIEWTLAVAASAALDVLVATLLSLAGVWSAELALIVIWVISLAGSLLPLDLRMDAGEEF